jgi:diketogulonate reductase-like aldo/keto reductase
MEREVGVSDSSTGRLEHLTDFVVFPIVWLVAECHVSNPQNEVILLKLMEELAGCCLEHWWKERYSVAAYGR